MQEEKILSEAIGSLLREIRHSKNKSLNLFCNEYSIPTSTLSDLENAKGSIKLFSLYKILKAYEYDICEFFLRLNEKLPENFLKPEE